VPNSRPLKINARAALARTACVGLFLILWVGAASADALGQGRAAFARGDYARAARLLAPLAQGRSARAQAMLGFMYENGLGVPQSYAAAADLYSRSAERGDPSGQYLLGLLYDKGHGLPRDDVLAYMWLNLAAAAAPSRDRETYLKIRNAVASKMSLEQVEQGQWLALNWRPTP
jgi:uncharacterized protein